ncbi:hypothetical protein DP133_11550 [Clostridium tetani]|nr:hypothetical protein DP133_11550 [Clostridium tetani]
MNRGVIVRQPDRLEFFEREWLQVSWRNHATEIPSVAKNITYLQINIYIKKINQEGLYMYVIKSERLKNFT